MPRGIYPRKKKSGAAAKPARKRRAIGIQKLIAQLQAERQRCEDRIVAIGTAIDALEEIES